MTVSPDLPVYDRAPDTPSFARSESGVAWPAVLEKATAGLDQTWSPQRQENWADSWHEICKADAIDCNIRIPRTGPPPDGYVRLNQGSTSWERAELLTQLTGKESVVRERPDDPEQILAVFARQLRDGKPVLAGSRPGVHQNEKLPHGLYPAHVYEVVAVTGEKILLRNPWNRAHPSPMSAEEFAASMRPEYTTLK